MVQVRHQSHHEADRHEIDLSAWLDTLPAKLEPSERQRLLLAAELVRKLAEGPGEDQLDWAVESDCFKAGLDVALILSELHVGTDCLVAGMLYRVVREQRTSVAEVEQRFGPAVARLLQGVLKMAAIGDLRLQQDQPVLGQAHAQKDNIRKMLIALVDDVRVALIKLAERTCAIRAAKDDEGRRETVAREVFDVYAPLAHRLGIGHLKWELEDLSFRYIYADAYRKIARLLDGKRLERDHFIAEVKELLSAVLANAVK